MALIIYQGLVQMLGVPKFLIKLGSPPVATLDSLWEKLTKLAFDDFIFNLSKVLDGVLKRCTQGERW